MDKICDFKINGKTYTIYETNRIKGKKSILGYTDYDERIVVIERKRKFKTMLDTLQHELAHVWLYENGIDQDRMFHVEELCEVIAFSHEFIDNIVDLYVYSEAAL